MKLLGYVPTKSTSISSSSTKSTERERSISASRRPSISIDDILEKIRREMELRLGSKTEASRKLKELFAKFDKNGDGKISEMELTMTFDDMKVSQFHSFVHSDCSDSFYNS